MFSCANHRSYHKLFTYFLCDMKLRILYVKWSCSGHVTPKNVFGLQILLFIFVKYIKSKLSLRTVCSYHVMYAFQSESTRYSCLNVKELLTRSRCEIWGLSDCNLTHNSTLTTENSRLASLAKWLSVRSWTKWFCGFEPSCSHLHHIACVEDGILIKNLKESNSRKRRVTTFIRSSFIQVSNW